MKNLVVEKKKKILSSCNRLSTSINSVGITKRRRAYEASFQYPSGGVDVKNIRRVAVYTCCNTSAIYE
jgi:hypothetical protein